MVKSGKYWITTSFRLTSTTTRIETSCGRAPPPAIGAFRLTSTTTRIETGHFWSVLPALRLSDWLPQQQGLKLWHWGHDKAVGVLFQTDFHNNKDWNRWCGCIYIPSVLFQTDFHNNKDWNLVCWYRLRRLPRLSDWLPQQQGLKHEIMIKRNGKYELSDWLPQQQGLKPNGAWRISSEKMNFQTDFHNNKDWNMYRPKFNSGRPFLSDWLPQQQGLKLVDEDGIVNATGLSDWLPQQQGLKPFKCSSCIFMKSSFRLTSTTTRIETRVLFCIF